jgi:hypothetical protein
VPYRFERVTDSVQSLSKRWRTATTRIQDYVLDSPFFALVSMS